MRNEIPFISSKSPCFLEPKLALDDGLVGWGEEINEFLVLRAYELGIFPWYGKNDPVLWWSPNPRAVFLPNQIKISKSLKKNAKKYSISLNKNFQKIINLCKNTREETWINEKIIQIYISLHKKGIANSIEVYENNELVGGLYGLQIGSVFCGESMFSIKKDASKVALINLAKKIENQKFALIDAQIPNSHLYSLGAIDLPRNEYLNWLKKGRNFPLTLKI